MQREGEMGEITRRPAAAAAASSTSPSRPPARPPPPARSSPSPSSPASSTRHPPSRLPLHLVTPHGPGPNTLALALSPQTLTLLPHRLAAAAGPSSSAHSVQGKAPPCVACRVPSSVLLGSVLAAAVAGRAFRLLSCACAA